MNKLKSKKVILLLGLPLGLAVAAFAIFMFVLSPATAPAEPVGVADPAPYEHGFMLALPPETGAVYNLATGGTFRYLKLGVVVELRPEDAAYYKLAGDARAKADKELTAASAAILPVLQDAIGAVAMSHTSTELGSAEGRELLKQEVIDAIREALGSERVLSVWFTVMVMQ